MQQAILCQPLHQRHHFLLHNPRPFYLFFRRYLLLCHLFSLSHVENKRLKQETLALNYNNSHSFFKHVFTSAHERRKFTCLCFYWIIFFYGCLFKNFAIGYGALFRHNTIFRTKRQQKYFMQKWGKYFCRKTGLMCVLQLFVFYYYCITRIVFVYLKQSS